MDCIDRNFSKVMRAFEEFTINPATVEERTILLKVSQSNSSTRKISVTKLKGKPACY